MLLPSLSRQADRIHIDRGMPVSGSFGRPGGADLGALSAHPPVSRCRDKSVWSRWVEGVKDTFHRLAAGRTLHRAGSRSCVSSALLTVQASNGKAAMTTIKSSRVLERRTLDVEEFHPT